MNHELMNVEKSFKSTVKIGSTIPNTEVIELVQNEFQLLHQNNEKNTSFSEIRSRRYKDVNQTETLSIIYDPNLPGSLHPFFNKQYRSVWAKIDSAVEMIQRHYGSGYFARCIVASLPPGKAISAHSDPGWGFRIPRRVHWVLETNDKVIFKSGRLDLKMKVGELWELDNTKIHSVENAGVTNRIHVVFDYVAASDRNQHYCLNIDSESSEYRTLDYWFKRDRIK